MFQFIKAIFRLFLFIIIVTGFTVAYARYIEPNMLKVKEVSIESSFFQTDQKELKIAVFGDTHFGDYYTLEDFSKVLEAIDKMEPDLVVFAGDLIDHYDSYSGDTADISAKLSEISAPYGKFAVFGNHDYGGGAEYVYESIMEAGGFTVLKNKYYPLDELGVAVIGVDDVLIGYGNPEIVSWGRPDYYNIVLAHEPDVMDEVLDYNVDLMLSAHTHGRQINLKYFDDYILPAYGKKYIKGLYDFENARASRLYVTSGVGMTKLPFRFLSPPELTKIVIKKSN